MKSMEYGDDDEIKLIIETIRSKVSKYYTCKFIKLFSERHKVCLCFYPTAKEGGYVIMFLECEYFFGTP